MKVDELIHEHQIPALDFQDLHVISALGRGAKGVVFLAKDKASDKQLLALKVVSKALIEKKGKDRGEYKRICFEQQVLHRFRHPLLPRLRGVLATQNVVAYAMDYCPGGNLHSLRKRQTEKMFSDDVIRFYAAELVLALEYLHSLGIAYRDLKPENVMIQDNGHIMLIDFDLSTRLSTKTPRSSPNPSSVPKPHQVNKKRFSPLHRWCNSGISPDESASAGEVRVNSGKSECDSEEKCNSFVGTEEYVAPEIVSGKGHDFAVDWWSLGVLLYEMLYGMTPFKGSNRKETFYRILSKEPELTGETTPLRDLIAKLLEKDPKKRIELVGIKGHDFFEGVEWDDVPQMERPPFIPENESEDTEGRKNIDVELFVQGIFGNGEVEVQKGIDVENHNKEENTNKKPWVEEQNLTTNENDRFNIF
ncbi:serine/threonine-protein kinase OXI1-like [Juglans microcarpa x Juglans regia]|uniref:serine/threonine-protein kinase OXI1-like n=1 Tax=Juglans microcarpa x Juglans regia TaxID=2249226 RepID=UPI001B7E5BBF|nr:serine/threonine-protein kinase OXI1-like [Juglans microcarpa x Juglans regia]